MTERKKMAKLTEREKLKSSVAPSLESLKTIDKVASGKDEEIKKTRENSREQKLVNFYLSKSKIEEYRKMFGAAGLTLSQGIRVALDYTALELKAGKLVLSESGLHENLLGRLG